MGVVNLREAQQSSLVSQLFLVLKKTSGEPEDP